MKIPFTLDAWLKDKSQKVETKEGRPVKIISFEMTDTNDCPIAAQFRLCAGTPVVYLFDKEGHYKGEGDSDYDLFLITPEPELGEFEEKVKQLIGSYPCANKENKGLLLYEVRKAAAELLKLAKKELCESGEVTDWYAKGKAEALKDLPRWKRAASSFGNYSVAPTETGALCLLIDGHYIMLSELMKLPGFKED